MEEILINAYLKYQKEYIRKTRPDLLKMHWSVLVPYILALISTVSTLILTIISTFSVWNLISVVLMVLSYAIFMYTSENVRIKRSYEEFLDYCDYCTKLKDWLAKFSIDSNEKIAIIKERISEIISNLREACENSTGRVDKWLQVFATPIAIAVITAVIAGDDAMDEKMLIAVIIIIIFALVWTIGNIVGKMQNYSRKREIEQLEWFANDLQGILDTQFEGGIAYQEEKSRTDSEECSQTPSRERFLRAGYFNSGINKKDFINGKENQEY